MKAVNRRSACTAAAAVALLATAAAWNTVLAACQVYPEPDSCEMMWTTDDAFWVGEYSVEAGTAFMTFNGQPHNAPPEPLSMATIFQMGGDLVINHPEVVLQADLISVGLDAPDWAWDEDLDDGMPASSLSDVEVMVGCSSAQMPRWSAPVTTEDGTPMTLDLVAVGPFNIYGLLHADTVYEGVAVTVRRQINFSRESYPVDNLDLTTVESEGACEHICQNNPFRCPEW